MWIATPTGFLSIVKNESSTSPGDALLVRARVRADLQAFADIVDGVKPVITATPKADYPYRLTTSNRRLGEYLDSAAARITYPNFKDEIAKADILRARVYNEAWAALRGLAVVDRNNNTRRKR